MKKVPLKYLKENLSKVVAMVAKGTVVEVTKHNVACIRLVPADVLSGLPGVHVGKNFGKGSLKPAVKKCATNGRYLEILREDRDNEK